MPYFPIEYPKSLSYIYNNTKDYIRYSANKYFEKATPAIEKFKEEFFTTTGISIFAVRPLDYIGVSFFMKNSSLEYPNNMVLSFCPMIACAVDYVHQSERKKMDMMSENELIGGEKSNDILWIDRLYIEVVGSYATQINLFPETVKLLNDTYWFINPSWWNKKPQEEFEPDSADDLFLSYYGPVVLDPPSPG